jgi:uncharacterized protein YndB with AHSA1/START domain
MQTLADIHPATFRHRGDLGLTFSLRSEPMTSSNSTAIAVQTFKVPPQRVYDAILSAEMIGRFMFGPLLREETILHIRNEPRVGGSFSYKVRRGENEIDHVGRFLELVPPERIVFTWGIAGEADPDGSTVTIGITPTSEGCSVRLMHAMPPEWADFVDRSRAAWAKMLGVLATLL